MRISKGWLLHKDEETKREVPFFLKVRNEDIVNTKSIEIDQILTKTSELWRLDNSATGTDVSIYSFLTIDDIKNFSAGQMTGFKEKMPIRGFNGEATYILYGTGYYEVFLSFTIETPSTPGMQDVFNIPIPYEIKSPIAITPNTIVMDPSNLAFTFRLGKDKIENTMLNQKNTGSYVYKVCGKSFSFTFPSCSVGSTSSAGNTPTSYVEKYPINLSIKGIWK